MTRSLFYDIVVDIIRVQPEGGLGRKYVSYSALGTLLAISTLSQGKPHSNSPLERRDAWTPLPNFGLLS